MIAIGLLLPVIGTLSGGAYVIHHMMQRGFNTRTEPMPMEKALATTIRGGAIPSRYKTMKNPAATTPEVIHKGMRIGQTTAPPATPTTAVATPCMARRCIRARQTCARSTRRRCPMGEFYYTKGQGGKEEGPKITVQTS
jgi:hypothetical protein